MSTQIKTIWKGSMTGTTYHGYPWVQSKLKGGDKLELKREPNNVNDSNAIAVYFETHKIGWVPKTENKVLAALMDAGCNLECVCMQHDRDAEFQKKVYMVIGIVVAGGK